MNIKNRQAVIIIGSNSTRLLTAQIGTLAGPERARENTRLFAALGEDGSLSPEGICRTAEAVARLKECAEKAGAEKIYLAATSAARDAVNRSLLEKALLAQTGLSLRLLSGEEEARLSFLGATMGRKGCSGVIDIGGGSTEVAIGQREPRCISLQLGARRMLKSCIVNSPADSAKAVRIADAALSRLDELIDPTDHPIENWFLVGGTGTTLARMLLKLPINHSLPEDFVCTKQDAKDMLERIAALTAAERERLPGLPAERVDIMPAGLAILVALMDRAKITQLKVTERNNTDGFLLSAFVTRQA